MSRKHEKYRLKTEAHIEADMITSEAFNSLSSAGVRVLIRFLQKRTWSQKRGQPKPIYDNHGLSFTYDEALKVLGIPTSTFHITIKKLVAVGFLDVPYIGGAHKHDYSRYNLSDRWKAYGTTAFEFVEKERVLQQGLDVWSRMKKKNTLQKTVVDTLQETVAIEGGQNADESLIHKGTGGVFNRRTSYPSENCRDYKILPGGSGLSMKAFNGSQRADGVVRVSTGQVVDAQTKELRAIAEEVRQNPEESLDSILSRRPPWKGWINADGKVRKSPR